MKGRIEHQLAIEKNINRILKNLPDICTDYYNNIAVSKEPMTCQQYIRSVRGFVEYMTKEPKSFDFASVKESDLARYLHNLAIKRNADGSIEETSFSYRKLSHSVLNNFFCYLYHNGIQKTNLMERIGRTRNSDDIKRVRLTADDLTQIIDGARKATSDNENKQMWICRNVAIITLFIATGMRETALSEINIEDLDLKNRSLTIVDKRHKTHTYTLGSKVCSCLQEWICKRNSLLEQKNKTIDALFISWQIKRISPSTISNMVRQSAEAGLGKRLSPHKLRAAFCTILYDKTGDIELVRDAVGHGSVSVTQRYIVKSDAAKKKSAEIMNELL